MRHKPIPERLVDLVASPRRSDPTVSAIPMTTVSPRYLGVMRHAQQFRSSMEPEEEALPGRALSATGRSEAEAVAGRLAEYVAKEIERLGEDSEAGACGSRLARAVCVWYAPTPAAAETAGYVARAIVFEACPDLEQASDDAMLTRAILAICKEHDALWPDAEGLRSEDMTHPIVIEVGHDPDLTATLHSELSRNQPWPIRRLSYRTALRRGEIAMLKRTNNGGWEIDYVVSPGSENEISELQSKLKSKMDTAKVLGAFLIGLAFFAGRAVVDNPPATAWYPWVAGTGMALLAFSVVAYMVTMFLYDGLLMPTAFWPSAGKPKPTTDDSMFTSESTADDSDASVGEMSSQHERDARVISRGYRVVGTGQRPGRPPSSAATVILHSMQRVWGGMFVPATVAAGAGAALIGIALAEPSGASWVVVIGAVLLVSLAVWGFYMVSRSDLGHSD